MALLFEHNLGHFRVVHWCLGVREWPVKDNSNEHFAAIFLDEGLHLFKDRNCFFSHRMRSHSSRALCAKVLVCGGIFWAAGVPNARMKGLSGSVRTAGL